ncbi:MAG: FAD-binding oxidoreductase [Bacteroidota bacterium]|nr:FAD-binding oxidoreductase [Bacteroidota bacterium]
MQSFSLQKPGKKNKGTAYDTVLNYQPHNTLKVLEKRELTDSTYILRLERKNIKFLAGQHISLGLEEDNDTREYSVYSGERDDFIEVLIKEVQDGLVSKHLKKSEPGSLVKFDGPVGYFLISEEDRKNKKFLFIASGTGIAPFHSFARSYPGLDFQILHGVRYAEEAYEKHAYDPERITLCTSKDDKGDYQGRVTEYLKQNPVDKETHVYLCGNCEMIHDAYDILLDQGLPADNLHSEVYF